MERKISTKQACFLGTFYSSARPGYHGRRGNRRRNGPSRRWRNRASRRTSSEDRARRDGSVSAGARSPRAGLGRQGGIWHGRKSGRAGFRHDEELRRRGQAGDPPRVKRRDAALPASGRFAASDAVVPVADPICQSTRARSLADARCRCRSREWTPLDLPTSLPPPLRESPGCRNRRMSGGYMRRRRSGSRISPQQIECFSFLHGKKSSRSSLCAFQLITSSAGSGRSELENPSWPGRAGR